MTRSYLSIKTLSNVNINKLFYFEVETFELGVSN